jgi:ArsR family transcriptional regulator
MVLNPAQLFKLLSDETRLRCVVLLHRSGELCVCELTKALQLSQPKISRHLAMLRSCGLLLDRRQAAWVYYRIHPELSAWARDILAGTVKATAEFQEFQQDWERIQGGDEIFDFTLNPSLGDVG